MKKNQNNGNFLKFKFLIFCLILLFAIGGCGEKKDSSKGVQSEPVVIYLTRHGETTANVMGRVQGWSDFPLTENGLKVADELGKGLKGITFVSSYSGNLPRHERTAEHILENSENNKVKNHPKKELLEGGYGSFEGLEFDEVTPLTAQEAGYSSSDEMSNETGREFWVKLQDSYYSLDKKNITDNKLGNQERAEKSQEVQDRMKKALIEIAEETQTTGGGNVLVVSSGMSIAEFLTDIEPSYDGKPIPNVSITKLEYENGKLKVKDKIGSLEYTPDLEK